MERFGCVEVNTTNTVAATGTTVTAMTRNSVRSSSQRVTGRFFFAVASVPTANTVPVYVVRPKHFPTNGLMSDMNELINMFCGTDILASVGFRTEVRILSPKRLEYCPVPAHGVK